MISVLKLESPEQGFDDLAKLVRDIPERCVLGAIGKAFLLRIMQEYDQHFNTIDRWQFLVLTEIFKTLEQSNSGDDEIMAGVFEAAMEYHSNAYRKHIAERQKEREEKAAQIASEENV